MAQSYLNEDGLTLLWALIKSQIAQDGQNKVTDVAYDSTNNKITKTINGTTTDVVTLEAIQSAMGFGIDLDGTVHI